MDPYLEHPEIWPGVHLLLIIDLHTLLSDIYDRAAYDLKLDYNTAPVPPLSATDAAWTYAL